MRLALLLLAALAGAAGPRKPDIVIFLADDLGLGDVAALSMSCRIRTPYLDGFATEGMRLRDFHSNSSVCTPTRYGLLTGRHAWRTRLQKGVLEGDSPPLIEEGRPTVASVLRDSGYRTVLVGKWHLGLGWAKGPDGRIDFGAPFKGGPLERGFETFFGIAASADMPPYGFLEADRSAAPLVRSVGAAEGLSRPGPAAEGWKPDHVLDAVVARAISELRKCASDPRPVFLLVSLPSPHTPIAPSASWRGRSGIGPYADFVMETDHAVGRVLMALRETGRAEDAFVVITSDNGCSPAAGLKELATHDHFPSAGFRGTKSDLFEGGHRVPCLVRWPGRVARGSESQALAGMTDWFATLAEVAGAPRGTRGGEDSVSLLPVLTGKAASVRETYVMHSIDGAFAIRRGSLKLLATRGSGGWSEPNARTKGLDRLPAMQLYDLREDPAESENLYRVRGDDVDELQEELARQIKAGRTTPGPASPNDVEVRVPAGR